MPSIAVCESPPPLFELLLLLPVPVPELVNPPEVGVAAAGCPRSRVFTVNDEATVAEAESEDGPRNTEMDEDGTRVLPIAVR